MKIWCSDNVYSDANANIPHINIKMLTMSGIHWWLILHVPETWGGGGGGWNVKLWDGYLYITGLCFWVLSRIHTTRCQECTIPRKLIRGARHVLTMTCPCKRPINKPLSNKTNILKTFRRHLYVHGLVWCAPMHVSKYHFVLCVISRAHWSIHIWWLKRTSLQMFIHMINGLQR